MGALMGPSRDVSAKNRTEDWKDRTVCKRFLLGLCPYDKAMLGGRGSFEPCQKIHNEILRQSFNASKDGKTDSKFRRDCEERVLKDLEELLAEKEQYAKTQLERKKTEAAKHVKLPDEVNARSSEMKREANKMKDEAAALEDCDARKKEQLLKDMQTLLNDRDAYVKEEERKVHAASEPIKNCEDCGTAYASESEYKNHLGFTRHTSFVQ